MIPFKDRLRASHLFPTPLWRACIVLPYFVVGCSDPSSVARSIGHARLKADALAMLSQWNAGSPQGRLIPRDLWPVSILKLEPIEVYPHMLGVLAVTEKKGSYHYGVYIVTGDDELEQTAPSSGSGLSYQPIARGLHLAQVKIRTPYR